MTICISIQLFSVQRPAASSATGCGLASETSKAELRLKQCCVDVPRLGARLRKSKIPLSGTQGPGDCRLSGELYI
jgi:hypothetical protein